MPADTLRQAYLRKPLPGGRGRLELAVGMASHTGQREANQDVVAFRAGDPFEQITHGAAAVLADGMGGGRGGGLAARLACESFFEGYYALSPTLGVVHAGHRALAAYNRWLHAMSRADAGLARAGCTFTALVCKGRSAHLLHVGDSRAWLWRAGRLTRLSEDHTAPGLEDSGILLRAVGLEPELRLDHAVWRLEAHDRLLLTSDGVHGVLAAGAIEDLLGRQTSPHHAAEALAAQALAAGSTDNASAVVVDVVGLPDPDRAGLAELAAGLPVLPAPRAGEVIDSLRLERQLSDGEQTRAFLARRIGADARYVVKFPRPERVGEQRARAAFVREQLIAARIDSPHLAQVLPMAPEAQSRVYTLMPCYEGETLEARLQRGGVDLAEGLAMAIGLARGIVALHRLGIVHRDIKPDNVWIEPAGAVRLLDFGVARMAGLDDADDLDVPGTHGYLAPELYRGEQGDAASDQFAFGVTLYRLFCGVLPYSDLGALQRPGQAGPPEPAQWSPEIPAWLAMAMRRMVQGDPADRFGDMVEVMLVLERGCHRAMPRPRPLSLIERHPVAFWQMVSAGLALVLAAMIVLRGLKM